MPVHLPERNSLLPSLLRSITGTVTAITLAAVLFAWGSRLLLPSIFTTLDWAHYDHWVGHHSPSASASPLVLVTRDAAGEARFGTGAWDHALSARAITALTRAGATVIGLDVQLGASSPPGRGGAASDAMLIDAARFSGQVVLPITVRPVVATGIEKRPAADLVHRTWNVMPSAKLSSLLPVAPMHVPRPVLAQQAITLGHTLAMPDQDGVVRRVPLYVRVDDRAVPSFGLGLFSSFLKIAPAEVSIIPGQVSFPDVRAADGKARRISIPVDNRGRMLIRYAGREDQPPFLSIPFLQIWDAIEHGEPDKLRAWVGGKIVLLLPGERDAATRPTPLGESVSEGFIQANVVSTLLGENGAGEAPAATGILAALLLAACAAWLLLTVTEWLGVAGIAALALAYVVIAVTALWLGHRVMPVWSPLFALALASGGTTLWIHLVTGHRIRMMESHTQQVQQELAATRELLVCRESIVEGLEEDLDAARAAVGRSAGAEQDLIRSAEALRAQLAEAQAQEDLARRRLEQLDGELSGLRATRAQPGELGDTEQERLRQACEQMGLITRDPVMLGLFRDLKKAARSPLSLLIVGEPGTGKELFAQAAHRLSARADRPFVAVNMAAISPELFESELFGHVKGSFTGALADRKGYFEQAHGGTIFLDEIGDLRLDHQGKLLRVLQNRQFHRVGDTRLTTIDVRVVAATNKDLQRGVAEGWFREDLYFRVKGMVFTLPPLRDRREDVPALAHACVREAATHAGRPELDLSHEAMTVLRTYSWKGNIRELHHCLERAVALAEGPIITKADLRLTAETQPGLSETRDPSWPDDAARDAAVLACLRRHEFDMQATARELDWDRSTVTQRLKGMSFRALVAAGGDQRKAALALAGDPMLVHAVEWKLREYYEHLIKTIQEFKSADDAVTACKKRFKNLPDRHFHSVEVLINRHFDRKAGA